MILGTNDPTRSTSNRVRSGIEYKGLLGAWKVDMYRVDDIPKYNNLFIRDGERVVLV